MSRVDDDDCDVPRTLQMGKGELCLGPAVPGTGCCSGADAHGRAAPTLDAARNGGGEGNLCGSRQSVRQST